MENWPSGFSYPPMVGSNLYSFGPTLNQENNALIGANQVSAVVFNAENSLPKENSKEPTYTYYVKIINTKKKSDYVVRLWHGVNNAFKSPAEIKLGLMDTFPAEVPSKSTFQVG